MDTEQGLCLGALFDIAATNVTIRILLFWLLKPPLCFLFPILGLIFMLSRKFCHSRDLIWAGDFVSLGFAVPLRC